MAHATHARIKPSGPRGATARERAVSAKTAAHGYARLQLVEGWAGIERMAQSVADLAILQPKARAREQTIPIDTATRAFQLIDSVVRDLDGLRQALEASLSIEPPRDRVQQTFAAELARGQLLESAGFQARASWTRQALSKAVAAHRVFYVEVGGVRAYPAFYLDSRYVRRQLEAVTKTLGKLSGGSKWQFFTAPKGSLARAEDGVPRTPLQALEAGDYDSVQRAALAFVQR